MVAAQLSENATLAELLSVCARRTPRDRLAIDIIGGVLIAAAAIWARPGGWAVIAAAGMCFASYGVWAVAELRLLPGAGLAPPPHERLWRGVRGAAGVVGIGAYVMLLFSALGLALGRLIS